MVHVNTTIALQSLTELRYRPITAMEQTPMLPNVPEDLTPYRIPSLPPEFYYIPNFLTPSEQTYLLQKVHDFPCPISQLITNEKSQIPPTRWTQLTHRRLQAQPSALTASNTLISSPLPPFLTAYPPILERFGKLGIFAHTKHAAPNHVLINEYKAGEGIMPHEDGAAYSPVVATVSLGASLVLEVWEKKGDGAKEDPGMKSRRILQEPGSLLVTTGEAYTSLLHGISEIEVDEDLTEETVVNWNLLGDKTQFQDGVNKRGTRISLTYRDVLKVSKVGIGILGRR
jgi:alkylated DNA repair protein alkB family protein 6